MRRYYRTVWEKAGSNRPLEPLERLIAEVIREHPEYQPVLTEARAPVARLHPGKWPSCTWHAHRDSGATGWRPPGPAFSWFTSGFVGGWTVTPPRHLMMECLGETLWEARRGGGEPDGTGLSGTVAATGAKNLMKSRMKTPASAGVFHGY